MPMIIPPRTLGIEARSVMLLDISVGLQSNYCTEVVGKAEDAKTVGILFTASIQFPAQRMGGLIYCALEGLGNCLEDWGTLLDWKIAGNDG